MRSESDRGLRIAYAAALGRLEEIRAAPDILDLLANAEEAEACQELALALARLVGDENHFILLVRSLKDDPGTAFSQELLALRKKWSAADDAGDVQQAFDNCLEAFSRQDMENGTRELAELIEAAPKEHYDPTARLILGACQEQLRLHQQKRLEYPALALFALNLGWHGQQMPFVQPDQVG